MFSADNPTNTTSDKWLREKNKYWTFVTENGGSIDTLHYKLGVNDFKCDD